MLSNEKGTDENVSSAENIKFKKLRHIYVSH